MAQAHVTERGYDVWIRPDGKHGLVLLGGLKKKDVQALRERGFAPAMVVETGPEQYQAWVKLSQDAWAEPLRGRAADLLVQGADRHGGNAISRADGRLAEFTNQQVQRASGRHPIVLVTECDGRIASAAPVYLIEIEQEQAKVQESQRDRQRSRSRGSER
ncbi:DNA-primase RepB domain-containing protein [Duganella violaceipulchra]|uniref:RepB family DNA primase n=1 Tax=Duganella violaceipulchra TaxID=2849652 RepID=A0AA41HD57_9BURK|nr:RepB family DNA primase [Duganella violaceicalia]MCP2011565.1 hypothetical protein [Duganella violaceicalia]